MININDNDNKQIMIDIQVFVSNMGTHVMHYGAKKCIAKLQFRIFRDTLYDELCLNVFTLHSRYSY